MEPIWDFEGVKNCQLVGYMKYARCEVESCFGIPHNELEDSPQADDNKVQYEWWFKIYDYKQYRDVPEDEPILWHIGGEDFEAILKIQWLGFEKAMTRPEYTTGEKNIWLLKWKQKLKLT